MNEKKADQIKKAAALKYDAMSDSAPYVIAIGKGVTAEHMVEEAEDKGVHVVEDKKLANMLADLSVGDEIPEELYLVVAEILVFISDMDNERKQKFTGSGVGQS